MAEKDPAFVNRREADAVHAQILVMMHSLHEKLDSHTEEEMAKWEQIESKLDGVLIAFPDGDTYRHKMYHEEREIDRARQEQFINDLKKEVGKWGIISVLGFIIASIWYYLTHMHHK